MAKSVCQPSDLHHLQPAKLVAKIRSMSTSNNLLLFKVTGLFTYIIMLAHGHAFLGNSSNF
jgi:protease II